MIIELLHGYAGFCVHIEASLEDCEAFIAQLACNGSWELVLATLDAFYRFNRASAPKWQLSE